jgi:toxin ParE1/3/4
VTFRLSTAAEADLAGIRTFTLERWGRQQWLAYRAGLVGTFERIAAQPGIGRRRDSFRPGLRSVPCGAHVVFYLELGGGVVGVVRVLHARQNAAALRWSEGMG